MTETLGIVVHGATGRMGANQHLVRSLLAIRAQGGVALSDGRRVLPDLLLVGRDPAKLAALAARHGVAAWTTDFDAALSDPRPVFFDAALTLSRAAVLERAVGAGKHVYCEKPVAARAADAVAAARKARDAGVKHGVVQDKLWLPGIRKLARLVESGFFGRILAVRGEFGYWVFPGDRESAQRPSWNYRAADGGGIVLDMLPHWHYLLENLFGRVVGVSCRAAIHVPIRWDEAGERYDATAADAAYTSFEIEGGLFVHFNSSWCVRVRRDDLLTIQVDGTRGSAVAGLRECRVQAGADTPRVVWNPDAPAAVDYAAGWRPAPDLEASDNAFKAQWEAFIRHVCEDAPFPWDLFAGARGVQLAESALQSAAERRWIAPPRVEE